MHQKMPALVDRKGSIFLHDNEEPRETLSHPAYSPNLALRDFHFFKHLDNFLTEKIFRDDENIKTAFEAFTESKTLDFYVKGTNKLISTLQKCVDPDSFYFE
uniref:Histone-lysine N-methyltransferase SETMAR n=1 Tax=Strongyloides venezuelensis TaxID=75913 RepID=A0A0K0F1G8_STRVS